MVLCDDDGAENERDDKVVDGGWGWEGKQTHCTRTHAEHTHVNKHKQEYLMYFSKMGSLVCII